MGCRKSSSKWEVYSYTSLPQETKKISNKQSNLAPKGTRERRHKLSITGVKKKDTTPDLTDIKRIIREKYNNSRHIN